MAACQRGLRVRYTTAAALVNELVEASDEHLLSAPCRPLRPARPALPRKPQVVVRESRAGHGCRRQQLRRRDGRHGEHVAKFPDRPSIVLAGIAALDEE